MSKKIPDEMLVAKLSMEAASIALESLFEKMKTSPRSEKVIATDPVQEAISRLRVAQGLISDLETRLLTGEAAGGSTSADKPR